MDLFKADDESRGVTDRRERLTAESVFSLVRDMPYVRASSRNPKSIIVECSGTCSGKHYLHSSLLNELGYQTQLVMCTHRFTLDNTGHFPEFLKKIVAEKPVPDVHTYARLLNDGNWMNVDATWPKCAEELGISVNLDFGLGKDMELACDPIEFFPVP